MQSTIEIRSLAPQEAEINLEADAPKLTGYAARFMSLSHDLGGFREQILPGAFKDSLTSGPDVLALAHHDEKLVLGRRSAGTLSVYEDASGLRFSLDPPETSYAEDIIALIRRGDLFGMSFGFNVLDDDIRTDTEGNIVRELRKVELHEISIVTWAAYPAPKVNLRSLQDRIEDLKDRDSYKRLHTAWLVQRHAEQI